MSADSSRGSGRFHRRTRVPIGGGGACPPTYPRPVLPPQGGGEGGGGRVEGGANLRSRIGSAHAGFTVANANATIAARGGGSVPRRDGETSLFKTHEHVAPQQ